MLKKVVMFGVTRPSFIVAALSGFLILGIAAFTKLNIEAYPNPAPVILEVTAQAPGTLGRRDGTAIHHSP